ncbi:MAG TPA: GspH/FimT family pseudopilin [Burkholderiaceae bacterium]|nr:GspH/FimT family pseudopilin [Burkholderiaceae bacterium]
MESRTKIIQGGGARRVRGLTLVELLVTMVIAAILLAYGVPSLQSFVASNQLATSANELVASLNLARSEAVRTSAPVGVCVEGGNSWIVAPLTGGSLTATCDKTQTIRAGAPSGPQLTVDALIVPVAGSGAIAFDALGRLVTSGGATLAEIMVCRGGSPVAGGVSSSRAVLVAQSGRIRVATTDTNGYPLDANGAEIAGC